LASTLAHDDCGPSAILLDVARLVGWWLCLLALAAVCAAPIPAIAQDAAQLVVVIPNDKEFHQPGCPLVAKAGSRVTIMKRGEAVRKHLTPHAACFNGDGTASTLNPNTVKVYTQPGDNKYHTANCPKLGASRSAVTLDQAGRKYWPCPVCKPPIRQRVAQ
jgi:hypothetical protein